MNGDTRLNPIIVTGLKLELSINWFLSVRGHRCIYSELLYALTTETMNMIVPTVS